MTDVEFRKCASIILQHYGLQGASLQEALEKQADFGEVLGKIAPIAKSIASRTFGTSIKGVGSFLQGAGRILGANGDSRVGKFHPTGGKGIANWLATSGRKIMGMATGLKRSSSLGLRDLKAEGGGWGMAAKYVPGAVSTYLAAAPFLKMFGGGIGKTLAAPATALNMVKPTNIVKNLASKAIGAGVSKATQFVQDIAANQAYDASQQTAYQIANQLAQRSPWEHLYGMIDPQGYASKLYEAAVPQINQTFTDRMAGMGRANWQPQNLIQ